MVLQSSHYVELIGLSEGIGILCSKSISWNRNTSAYTETLVNSGNAVWPGTGNGSIGWHQNVFLLPRWLSYLYPLKKNEASGVYLNIFQLRPLLTTISHLDQSRSFWTGLPASTPSNPTVVLHQRALAIFQTRKSDHVASFITFHHSDQSHSASFPTPHSPLCSGHCSP